MSYQALYRRWRPQTLEDIIGQDHIQILKNQLITNRIVHAYLFCGTRGTGKTSTAKVFSRAVNCISPQEGNPCNKCEICKGITSGSNMDVMEIDAASNNGVDNIREIREEAVYTPAQSKYKVYIIDEVHMLSTGAFNALLKTLEEPPKHVIFILATTEPHKLPATILSRCQRFDFKRITTHNIIERLKHIVDSDNIKIDKEVLNLVARLAEGSMRDALSILDQCIAFSDDHIKYEDIAPIIGITDSAYLFNITKAIAENDTNKAIELIDELSEKGIDIINFIDNFIKHFRNLLLCKILSKPEEIIDMAEEEINNLIEQAKYLSQERLLSCIDTLSQSYSNLKWSENQRILLEITIIKLCNIELDTSASTLLARISEIEEKLSQGIQHINNTETSKKTPITTEKLSNYKIDKDQQDKKDIKVKPLKELEDNTSVNINSDPNQVIKAWPKILTELQKLQYVGLGGFLENAKPIIKNEKVNVILENSFIIDQDLKDGNKNLKTLKQVIKDITGKDIKVIFCTKQQVKDKEQAKSEDIIQELIKDKDKLGDKIQIYE